MLIPDGDEVFIVHPQGTPDDMLESLSKKRIPGSDQLKTAVTLYEQEIEQRNSAQSYQKSTTMVKKCMDQKMSSRNFEARNERIEKGALAKGEGKLVSVERATPANTSRDSCSEPPREVVSRKHSIFTHFPKDRNCEVRERTKITWAVQYLEPKTLVT